MADLGIYLNCASKKENVPKIEGFDRTVKERVQSAWSAMPSTRIYKLMIVHLVSTAILAKCFSLIETWWSTSQQKRYRKTCPWNCHGLQEVLMPPARWICPGTSIRLTPEHHQYRQNSQINHYRPPIKLSERLFLWEPPNRKTPLTLTCYPCKYDQGYDWTLWHF